jgi:hypothetical protein
MKEEIIDVDERGNLLAAESTTNYGLIKPGQDDFYNVDEFNQNMDTIDQQLKVNEKQINDLLQRNHLPAEDNRGVVTKPSDYKSQFAFAGLKSEGVTGLPTWAHMFGVNAYSGIDGFTNVYEYAFCNGEMYIRNQYPLNEDTWGEWQQLATTSKTDISLVNQWTKGIGDMNQYVSKTGNTVTVNASIKGGISDENTVIFTLPDGFKPNSNLVIAGAKNWSKEEVARFITVRTNGEVILRSGFNSSDTYILDFAFSIN